MKKIVLFSALALLFNSCDTQTGGCIDPYANNYESFADYDDGSCLYLGCDDPLAINYNILYTTDYPVCIYSSDIVFYEDVAAALYFNALGVNWLDLSVDGEYIGTLDATLGLTYIPDCNEIDAIAFSLEWNDAIASSFTWVIRDETGFKHYEGVEAVLPNDCLPIGLTFQKIQEYKDASK